MYRSISRKSIMVFRLRYTAVCSAISFILGLLGIINFHFYLFSLSAVFIMFVFLFFFYAYRRYESFSFFINSRNLNLCYGVFFTKRITFSIDKLQYIEVRQGIDERILCLSTLVFYTAGGKIKIPALDNRTALSIKKCLYRSLK